MTATSAVLSAIVAQWRPSLFAGFMGATASQFWFLAFALATAASVRTLALVEVLFAQAISAFVFGHKTSAREGVGIRDQPPVVAKLVELCEIGDAGTLPLTPRGAHGRSVQVPL